MTDKFGYYFHPAQYKGLPGHPQLDVNIYAEPTEEHFDPERVTFSVGDSGRLSHITVTHPWSGDKRLRICVGRIILQDRRDKSEEAFSFGGDLEITDQDSYTSCRLTSPASIFHLVDGQALTTLLVSEFEAELARQRAHHAGERTKFEARLIEIEPHTLFVAGLAAIKENLAHLPAEARRRERYQKANHIVAEAIAVIKKNGNWPEPPPRLSKLLEIL